jgi:diacylglycerol kinase (ATP)
MQVRSFLDSFRCAVSGVGYALRTQRNLRIHFAAGTAVLVVSFYLGVNRHDLLILFFAISLVLITEMVNTAIEAAVDLYTNTFHPLARIAKNVAAGAVLVSAVNAVLVGVFVFYDYLLLLFRRLF